jgi:hypothetical protein
VVEDCDLGGRPLVVRTNLDTDGALAGRRQCHLLVQHLRDPVAASQSMESSGREHEHIGLPFVEASQSSVDVAVQRVKHQVRPAG